MLRLPRPRAWEISALVLGALLRVSMALTHDARIGFDFNGHWPNIAYITAHHALFPLGLSAVSYHPPLYHVIAALLVGRGLGPGALGWLAVLLGILRLLVVWVGLERWLPESRLARVVALFTAAVLPAAVQLDGMVTNEPLSTLFCALAIVAAPAAIEGLRAGRVAPTAWLALWLGLALITKISAVVLVVSLLVAVAVDVARGPEPWGSAWRARAKPLAVGAALVAALSGWFFVRNQVLYGQPAPTAYDAMLKPNQAPYEKIPYLQRRPLGFFLGWAPSVFASPYTPSGYAPEPRFFSVMVASTFSDFYLYDFAARDARTPTVEVRRHPVPTLAFTLSRLSTIGGTLLAALALAAWFGSWRAFRGRPPDARLFFLPLPLLAVLGQMHFSTKYPNDNFGTIKGTYLQFVAPVLFGLTGIAVAWMWRRTWARVGAIAAVAALALVALYTIDCRWPRVGPRATGPAPFFEK
ncbi:MAG TPA: hypothetical protein VHO06_25155, partial [Polyangia bacterium]|nr:hypothetical protein [Polyangia bacterium]